MDLVDCPVWEQLTTFPELVDAFPNNVDFVRILFTPHLIIFIKECVNSRDNAGNMKKFSYLCSRTVKDMRKHLLLFMLIFVAASVTAQSTRKLRSFFTESHVQNLFYYAHPNAGAFNGVEIKQISSDEVVLKASFESDSWLFSSTYRCTIRIEVDGDEHFTRITTRCDSGASSRWPCFKWATEELQKKCRDADHNRRPLSFMEDHFGKRLRDFTGEEAMCALLTIALYNYDY
jgi:hypothetical protein